MFDFFSSILLFVFIMNIKFNVLHKEKTFSDKNKLFKNL